jgi:hypothetical protein
MPHYSLPLAADDLLDITQHPGACSARVQHTLRGPWNRHGPALADGCGPFAVPFRAPCGPFAVSRPANSREHSPARPSVFGDIRPCSLLFVVP